MSIFKSISRFIDDLSGTGGAEEAQQREGQTHGENQDAGDQQEFSINRLHASILGFCGLGPRILRLFEPNNTVLFRFLTDASNI